MISADNEIRCFWSSAFEQGGCNGCRRYVTASGNLPHAVLVIDLGRLVFRLCQTCISDLQSLIKQVGKR